MTRGRNRARNRLKKIVMRELTLSEIEQSQAVVEVAEETFHMDEESFRAFYARSARPLWCYLSRVLCDSATADDLLQESYYRFLRAKLPEMNEAYRKNYLYRIATNLLRDHWRRTKGERVSVAEITELPAGDLTTEKIHEQSDLTRVLQQLKPRERSILWLAYVEGSSHREIADRIGLKAESVRPLLFRARRKLAGLLRRRGLVD